MWLDHYRAFWTERLAALETYLLSKDAPKPETPLEDEP